MAFSGWTKQPNWTRSQLRTWRVFCCLPVWLWFRGGKGVATFLGVILALDFQAGAYTCLTWVFVAIVSRYSSLSALIATASAPFWLWVVDGHRAVLCAAVLAAFVWGRHAANIMRLVRGEEPRIGKGR